MLRQREGQALVGMDTADLKKLLGPAQPNYRARQLYDALYRRQVASVSEISNLPQTLKNQVLENVSLGLPEIERRFDSADGTRRYLLKLADNRTIEAVLMPEESRNTICISSQVGCAVDCKFCLTALMGLERNLTAGEIVGQVLYVARENRLAPTGGGLNVVMMGMGEPLLNLENVLKATRLLTDSAGIGISPKAHHNFHLRNCLEDGGAGESGGETEARDFAKCFHGRAASRTHANNAQVSPFGPHASMPRVPAPAVGTADLRVRAAEGSERYGGGRAPRRAPDRQFESQG